MTFDEYQDAAARTAAGIPDPTIALATFGLGIAGEAGEVADLIKKHIGHGHPLDVEKVKKELGDVLWYVAAVAWACGVTLDDVAHANVAKLRARYPDGFSTAASLARADVPRRNCWMCRKNKHGNVCTDPSESVTRWIESIDGDITSGMPPTDADGCPSYEAKP